MNQEAHEVFGCDDLSCWRVADGVCWVQARQPGFVNLLRKRANARLVAWSVIGGYLRTFEVAMPLVQARQLVARYIQNADAANRPFDALERRQIAGKGKRDCGIEGSEKPALAAAGVP